MKRKSLLILLLLAAFAPWTTSFAQQALPYEYGFETTLEAEGWTKQNPSGLNDSEFGIVGTAAQTGSNGFRFSSYNDRGESTQYLISKELSAASGVIVQFSYKASSSYTSGEKFKVGYSTTDNSIASFTFGSEVSATNTSWQLSEEYTFPAGTKYVAVYYYPNYQYRLYVDDFSFTEPSTDPFISLAPASETVFTGFTKTLTATYGNVTGTPTINYTSSNEGVATVSGNGTTATVTGVAPGTATITATMNYQGTDYTATAAITVEDPSHCQPAFYYDGTDYGFYISSFVLEGYINNATSYVTGGYSDYYDSHSAAVEPDEELNFTVTFPDQTYGCGLAIWVDWNNDYEFSSDERVAATSATTESSWSGSFPVPSTAPVGDHRMRVMLRYNTPSPSDPCVSGDYFGEAEDYKLTVAAPSDCPRSQNLTAQVTGDQAELSWASTATAWQVCINGDESNLIDITENPYTLENLDLSTTYTVKVRANCTASGDGYGDWSNTASFTTGICAADDMCAITYTLTDAYDDGWNGNKMEVRNHSTNELIATWTLSSGGSTTGTLSVCEGITLDFVYVASGNFQYENGWTITDVFDEVISTHIGCYSSSDCDAPAAGIIATHTVNCTVPTCIKPTMNATATNIEATEATVSWTAGGTNQDHWDVYYGTTNTAPTASTVPQIAYTTDNPCTLTGLNASTTYYVWVRGNCGTVEEPDYSDWSSAYCVFTTTAYCLDMLVYNSSIVFADLTSESVTVNFEGAGAATEWKVQLSTASDFSANLHEKVVTTASASFDGLEANKTYFVRVAPYCDEADDYTPWSPNRNFKTYCGIVTIDATHQWEEGFESYNTGSGSGAAVTDIQCWERVQYSTITNAPMVYRDYADAASHGSASLELKTGGGVTVMVALPEFSAHINDLNVAFNYNRSTTSYTYTAELGYISDVADASTFVKLFDIPTPVTRSNGYSEYSQDLYEAAAAANAPAGSRVAIRFATSYDYNSTYAPSWNFDDFVVSYVSGCRKPVDLTYSEVKSTTVKLNWVKTDDAQTSWDVAIKADGETDFTIRENEADTNVDFILTRLESETPYTVKVRTNCGDGTSDWSNEITFTTAHACMVPTDLAANNLTAVSAEITWTGESENYNVKYRELIPGETETTTEDFSSYEATTYNVAGSLPEGWMGYSSGSNKPHVSNNSKLGGSYDLEGFAGGESSTNNFLYMIGNSTSPNTSYTILPQISNLETVSFDYGFENADRGTLTVGYCTDNASGSTFTAFDDITLTGSKTSVTVYLTAADIALLNANNGYLTFRWTYSSSYGVGIDNVAITTRAYVGGEWQETTNNIDHGVALDELEAGKTYEVMVQSVCDATESDWSEVFTFTTLAEDTKVFVAEGNWNEGANWAPAGAPTLTDNVIIRANTTIPADCVALAAEITVEGTNTITIEDGGQLLHSTVAVYATMKKVVEPYEEAEGIDKYILLASPMQPTVYATEVNNLLFPATQDGYNVDFYKFDNSQEEEWVNLENVSEFQLTNGEGYLYAHNWESPITLAFKDALMYSNEPKAISLDYNSGNANWAGWNLIGNPFPCNATVSNAADPNATYNFYKINENDEIAPADGAVAPMEGIFALATEAGQEATFTRVVPSENSIAPTDGILNVNLMSNEAATRKGNSRIDMARLRFGHGNKLGKLNLFGSNAIVFFPQDGKDYSVMYADAQGEMPLHFKTEKNGTYTLGFSTEDISFGYLHLIDNMTGNDVDLLATPSYTFDARTTDYASRFRLVFSANGTNGDDNFGFIDAAGNLVITDATAGATLQIIDVMGRVVVSRDASNASAISTSGMTAGVYMLRLINGTNVKTQKIVVK